MNAQLNQISYPPFLPDNQTLLEEYKIYCGKLDLLPRSCRDRIRAAKKFLQSIEDLKYWCSLSIDEKIKSSGCIANVFINFLIIKKYYRPDYDYLFGQSIHTLSSELFKTSSIGRLLEFKECAIKLKFGEYHESLIPKVLLRVMAHTGKEIDELVPGDFEDFRNAIDIKEKLRREIKEHYRFSINAVQVILYHMGILKELPIHQAANKTIPYSDKLSFIKSDSIRNCMLAYLEKIRSTHKKSTVSGYALSFYHFMKFLQEHDPAVNEINQLSRQKHIEPWLIWVSNYKKLTKTGEEEISMEHKKNLIVNLKSFFYDIMEWEWVEAPTKLLVFGSDIPKIPRLLPRYIPQDQEKSFLCAVNQIKNTFARYGILIMRNTGIRISELLDLEMDCIHQVKGKGYWLKVPLGKLNTERMVPITEEIVEMFDEIVKIRGSQRAITNPKTGRLTDFLFVNRGKRIGRDAIDNGIKNAVLISGLIDATGNPVRITSHRLRHTYATSLINAGMSIQSLMKILGHVSSAMTLRYAHIFNESVRDEYIKALDILKPKYSQGIFNVENKNSINWMEIKKPLIKTRLANGYCIRTLDQGICKHANVCESCGNFQTGSAFGDIIKSQITEEKAILNDACKYQLESEILRHKNIIKSLEKLLDRIK